MARSRKKKSSSTPGDAHLDHLRARKEHVAWLEDLARWRGEYEEALKKYARRTLRELDLGNFEDALDKHEAAIYAHQELVQRHEQMIKAEKAGSVGATSQFNPVHEQMNARHERSRREHEHLARAHRAILEAIAMLKPPR